MLASDNSEPLEAQEQPKLRLAYLDGLRGLAALYVVLFHVYQECTARREIPTNILNLAKPLAYAEVAVAMFILLSGYCLMLPVARSRDRQIPGGVLRYFKRRIRYILFPYYAALLFSLLLLGITIDLEKVLGIQWDKLSMGFQPGVVPGWDTIVSHVLMIHNWSLDWAYAINGPLWSLASQWQLYLLFPILLLPMHRRFGIVVTVAIAFVIGFLPHYIAPAWAEYTVSPWFLGLFSLGMMAALVNFSEAKSVVAWRSRLPWGVLAGSLWTGLVVIVSAEPAPLGTSKSLSCLAGVAAACLIIFCSQIAIKDKNVRYPWMIQVLEAKPLVALGIRSYSLYLTHIPIVVLVHQFLLSRSLPPAMTFFGLLAIAPPLAVVVARLFYRVFEQRPVSVKPAL